jgi:hypothetical protein
MFFHVRALRAERRQKSSKERTGKKGFSGTPIPKKSLKMGFWYRS